MSPGNGQTRTHAERSGTEFGSVKRMSILVILKLAAFAVVLFASSLVCGSAMAGETAGLKGATETMQLSQRNADSPSRVPPIDLEAPRTTETATFAVG